AALLLGFLARKTGAPRLKLARMRLDKEAVRGCLTAGFLPFLLLAAEGTALACLNASLYKYGGEAALGAMAVASGVLALFFLPLMGLALGAVPALRRSFAARRPEQIKRAALLVLAACALYALALWCAIQLWPQGFVRIFSGDGGLLRAAMPALRLYFAVACVLGVQLGLEAVLAALGRVKSACLLVLLHRALLICFVFLLPGFNLAISGLDAVWLAVPAADAVSVLLAAALFIPGFRGALAQSVDEHWQSGFFRFLRKAILLFTGPMKTVWEEPFSRAPSVFVCNHDRAFGPIAMNVQFERCTDIRPWINAQMLSEREAPAYIREDYWWDPNKWYAPILSHTLAYFYALLVPPILRGADCVPVYHDTGVMSTLRASVKTLADGKHLLLFPEKPEGFRQYGTEISSGFVSVGKLYYGREKQSVHFYPAWVDWKGREIRVGKPLAYDPSAKYDEQAAAIASAIEDFFARCAQQPGQ
ncbi:MAG: MATE family efflux transporter, partial [Bacillota bacterium]